MASKKRKAHDKALELTSALEKAQKRREAAAEYRRADLKARRRHWDAPKSEVRPIGRPRRCTRSPSGPPTSPTPDPEIPDLSINNPAHHNFVRDKEPGDSDNVDAPGAPVVSAGDVSALNILADMAAEAMAVHSAVTVAPSSDMIFSVPSLSRHSSVAAVDDEPIRLPKRIVPDIYFDPRDQPLPRNVAPPSLLQKRVRRQTGLFGPLTPVQRAQIFVGEINHERPAAAIPQLFMSSERLGAVREWRRGVQVDVDVDVDGDWDTEARWAFAEAALRCRVSS
ncbi:hypothetical protein C8R47DRAFT_1207444 [Mycena vitilis]|nr:hypothetical protein C8R47DRAFT_1207444 [Mycena vitilis]